MAASGQAPTPGEYVQHHLVHLQNQKQVGPLDFTVVNYDQRGAGRTLTLNPQDAVADTLHVQRYVDDAIARGGRAEAPPLLLLHGVTRNHGDFAGLFPRLADDWRLIAVDHGRVVVCETGEGWRTLPGGSRERHESIEETAARELAEEAGYLLAGPVSWFASFTMTGNSRPWRD